MSLLVMLRHGQSKWNEANLFTGWVDIPLSELGVKEAMESGTRIATTNFDLIFSSELMRAKMTVGLAFLNHTSRKIPVFLHPGEDKMESWGRVYDEKTEATLIPVISAWELNERMYGALQGLDKDETRRKFGVEQVQIWRRSYDIAPPEGESLEMTAARSIPYFKKNIVPHLEAHKNVLLVAHGNSIRSITMEIEGLTRDEVVRVEIPTGIPITYTYDGGRFLKAAP